MFKAINPKQSFSQMEKKILQFWEKNKIFEKSIEMRPKEKCFIFYDGPPFATGLPHYGHIVASLIKDIIPRYKTMQGFRVERRWGWDCHGLPIENLIEKEKKIKSKKDIEGNLQGFNQACQESVLRYRDYWKKFIPRIGRWVDMENDYRTMDYSYMESIWWVFKTLYKKGLVYEGYKSMHLCPRCETTLSNFEVSLGYKEIEDLSATVKFKIRDDSKKTKLLLSHTFPGASLYFLAWTTTPWTLPGNAALAVKPGLDYAVIDLLDNPVKEYYIIAKDRIDVFFGNQRYKVQQTIKGKALVGIRYEPLFDFFKEYIQKNKNIYQVYPADFIEIDQGTGIVHIAPSFGEDDLELGKKYNLPFLQHVQPNGTFTSDIGLWQGEKVKPKNNPQQIDKKIVEYLEKKGRLVKQELVKHSYPHCWRCDTPLLNYRANSWFVKVTAIKDQLIKNNQKINWVPAHLKNGRFGKWLRNARDWALSRSRYWGAPLPVWKCTECGRVKIIGSVRELLEHKKGKSKESGFFSKAKYNLHRPFIDKIKFKCRCGQAMRRVPEVFDCWFESGSMPYAQHHYLGKPQKDFDPLIGRGFPADFISEGMDQTRGWFYTLHVLSTALFNQIAYKQAVAHGIVLAEDGRKMSKRLKNYPDPAKIVEKYGADALRLYLISSPVVLGKNLCFSENDLKTTMKRILLHLWNVLYFFITYAKIDQWTPSAEQTKNEPTKNLLDQWILSRLNSLVLKEKDWLDGYNLFKTVGEFDKFIDQLSNWYVRRSRRRFWKSGNDQDKQDAYQTLYTVLVALSKLMAPFTPFISEYIYQTLTLTKKGKAGLAAGRKISVHLCDYPQADQDLIQPKLNMKMNLVLRIVKLAHQIRNQAGISLRQPLNEIKIKSSEADHLLERRFFDLIKEEVNVKKLKLIKNLGQLSVQEIKLNLSLLGRKYRGRLKKIQELLKNKQYKFVENRLKFKNFVLEGDEFRVEHQARNPRKWRLALDKDLAVLLDVELTSSLKTEYKKKNLVRKIQEERKRRGFKVESYINLYYNLKSKRELNLFDQDVKSEILAKELISSEKLTQKIKDKDKLFLNKKDWIYLQEL